jgi:hypothetical protein
MTAQDFNNLARCCRARLVAARSVRTVDDAEFTPVVQLLQLGCRAAEREIAANGFTYL